MDENEDFWINLNAPANDAGDSPPSALSVETLPCSSAGNVMGLIFQDKPPAASQSHVYALLDAAKVFGLPEMLEASGLEHACLFQGDAAEELRDVAPWIVKLEPDRKFTQGLFSSGAAPWQMLDYEPGIYLRSSASLQDLRAHLRKFTRMRDEAGKWYYLRFWEPRGADQTFAALPQPAVIKLFANVIEAYTVTTRPAILVRRLRPTTAI